MSDDPAKTETPPIGASSGRAPRWALPLLIAGFVVIGLVLTLGFAAGSTAVCSGCHQPQAAALAKTPHKGIACERCHLGARGPVFGRTDVALRMLPDSILGVRLTGSGRAVGNGVCISCHPKMVSAGVITKNGLRIDHTACIVDEPCESCHGASMHGAASRVARRPSMAECIACHTEKDVPKTCETCHVGKSSSDVSRDPELARTHGPEWKKLHGTGDLGSCVLCHEPSKCRGCHGVDYPHPVAFGANHGKTAIRVGSDSCLQCHGSQDYCDACHGAEMPHPVGFLQTHSKVATGVNDPACARCHVLDDCAECHAYHIHPGGARTPPGTRGKV